jgi:glycosyltransferase involved in cell wall biosynthesis
MSAKTSTDQTVESRKISVLIPAYNAAATIEATLDSVLAQTVRPFEILVLNDGSTDETPSILKRYEPQITVIHQKNSGVAAARTVLSDRAQGDVLAFLDSDDLWHPRYLEVQTKLFSQNPGAAACFVGHTNFQGYGNHHWDGDPATALPACEIISPLDFLKRYGQSTGDFACLTYCCIPKQTFAAAGPDRFRFSGVEDSFFLTLLALLGRSVLFCPAPLAAYRVTGGSLSANRLKTYASWVEVYKHLHPRYCQQATKPLLAAFHAAFASRRRQYAKLLMTAGRVAEARAEFLRSVACSSNPRSMAKSLSLWLGSFAPASLQPKWRPIARSAEGKSEA